MVTQLGQPVSIKGIREGLLVSLGDGSYVDVIRQLTAEFSQKRDFLQGSKMVLRLDERTLSYEQLAEIQKLFKENGLTLWTVLTNQASTRSIARKLGLATRLPGSPIDLDGNIISQPNEKAETSSTPPIQISPGGLLLKETIRSGRSIYNEGHVVVIGDVNPGAEIIAGGDVIVWGRLRGLVHAGALGDETSVICALELNPTQLRIANQIAVPPDEKRRKPVPEQAVIRGSQIIAEPWQMRS